jgi:hypothetical protein
MLLSGLNIRNLHLNNPILFLKRHYRHLNEILSIFIKNHYSTILSNLLNKIILNKVQSQNNFYPGQNKFYPAFASDAGTPSSPWKF